MLERAVLLAVDEAVTPLTPEYFSFDGINLFAGELAKVNKAYRKNTRHTKIVINNINQSYATHRAYQEAIGKLTAYDVFTIPQDRKIADAQINNKSIFEFAPTSKTISEYTRLAAAMGA